MNKQHRQEAWSFVFATFATCIVTIVMFYLKDDTFYVYSSFREDPLAMVLLNLLCSISGVFCLGGVTQWLLMMFDEL